jgi:MFS family permease
LLVLIAFTVPLTTLTSTAIALDAGANVQAWIMGAMSVGAAAGLLSSGAIGDDYGRRRTFVDGCVILLVTSILAAAAPTGVIFVIARILQGLGGAAILACSLGLIGHVFQSGAARARATGVWAAALGAGVAIGPLLSAGLDNLGGWRLPHAMTALGAGMLAMVGRRWLPESRAIEPRPIDVVGTALLGLGLASVLAGLTEVRMGWSLVAVTLLGGGLLLLVGFVVAEHRSSRPMLDLGLFRRADFVAAIVAALAAGAGVLSLVSFVPTLLERMLGVDKVLGATVLLAWSATSVVAAFATRWLPARATPRVQMIAGLLGVAVGQFMLLLSPNESIDRLVPGLILCGIANGVLNAALGHQAVSSVPSDRAAMGSGANNTARYLASAIGLTVITVLVTHAPSDSGTSGTVSEWNIAVWISVGLSVLGALVVSLVRTR